VPTYEYRCKSCGHELEVVQSFTDDALTECPACAGPLRKVFGSIGVTFKGSGFYKTDSRAASKSSSSSSTSSGEGSSSGDSSAGEKTSGGTPAGTSDGAKGASPSGGSSGGSSGDSSSKPAASAT